MRKSGSGGWPLVIVALIVAMPLNVTAQDRDRFVGIVAGPSQYDLSGTGTAAAVGIRVQASLNPRFGFETGITYLGYKSQDDASVRHIFPEAQIQLRRTAGDMRPYLGVGAGVSWRSASSRNSFDPTLTMAGGVRIPLGTDWQAQGELRLRAVEPWTGTTADWGIGLARRW